jgi:polar amino acid transport system substrate-binding protein
VKQVVDTAKRQGLVATYKKVQTRLDNYKQLGYSSAGVVIESSVEVFKPGDRVACAGGGYASHAEFVFVPKNLVAKVPDNVTFEEAAFATLGSIALQGVRQADAKIGEYVAVIGLGLVGLITVQLLKANGCRVIGLDILDNNFELARKLGCDDCIISNSRAIGKVEAFTQGYGTDAVIITAATNSNEPVELALEVARKKSKVVIVGAVRMNIPRAPFYEKELDLRNSCSYGPGRYDRNYEEGGNDYLIAYVRWTEKRNMEACLDLMSQTKLDVKSLITHSFNIEDALAAYDIITGKIEEKYLGILVEYPKLQENGRHEIKKIVLKDDRRVRNTSQEPSVGFIGAGNFAQSFLVPPLGKMGIHLKGVATSTPVNAKSVGKRFGFEYCASDADELLNDRDINTIFIATRHDSHAKYVIESLKRGKNVYVEKPLAISKQQLDEIISVYNARLDNGEEPFLMVGYNRRFSQPIKAIKEFFKERKEPLVLNYRVNAGFIPKTNWYQDEAQGGRILGEVCHFVDTMQFLTDATPLKAFAAGAEDPGNRYSMDNVNMTMAFSDGSIGTVSYIANAPKGLEKEYLEVLGDDKAAVMENFRKVVFFEDRKRWKKKFPGDKGHAKEIEIVSQALQRGNPAPISFDSLIATTCETLAAVESLRTGNIVQVKKT